MSNVVSYEYFTTKSGRRVKLVDLSCGHTMTVDVRDGSIEVGTTMHCDSCNKLPPMHEFKLNVVGNDSDLLHVKSAISEYFSKPIFTDVNIKVLNSSTRWIGTVSLSVTYRIRKADFIG